jgi:hypothetical protein
VAVRTILTVFLGLVKRRFSVPAFYAIVGVRSVGRASTTAA